jgi:hypothetical protein
MTLSMTVALNSTEQELIGDQTTSKAFNQCHQVVLVVGLVEDQAGTASKPVARYVD